MFFLICDNRRNLRFNRRPSTQISQIIAERFQMRSWFLYNDGPFRNFNSRRRLNHEESYRDGRLAVCG